jgi:hypothetical protein
MKTKTFDCVEMKRRGAAAVQARTAGMTPEQEVKFWREQTRLLRQHQQETLAAGERSDIGRRK